MEYINRGSKNKPNRRQGIFKVETIVRIENRYGDTIKHDVEIVEGYFDGEFNENGDFIIRKDNLQIDKQYFYNPCEQIESKSFWKRLWS